MLMLSSIQAVKSQAIHAGLNIWPPIGPHTYRNPILEVDRNTEVGYQGLGGLGWGHVPRQSLLRV